MLKVLCFTFYVTSSLDHSEGRRPLNARKFYVLRFMFYVDFAANQSRRTEKPQDLPQLAAVKKQIGSPLGHRLRCRYLSLAKGRCTPFPFEGKGLGIGLDPSLKLKRGRGDFRKSRRTEGDPRRRLNLKPKTAEGPITFNIE